MKKGSYEVCLVYNMDLEQQRPRFFMSEMYSGQDFLLVLFFLAIGCLKFFLLQL